MSINDVAAGLVALCKEGKFDEAVESYYGDNIVSVESSMPEGMEREQRGIEAVRAKSAWWSENMETKKVEVEGPFINGAQFTVLFRMDVVQKADGAAVHMEEIALYTVKDGKIVHEVFFG